MCMRSSRVSIQVVSPIGNLCLLHILLKLYAHCTSREDAYTLELSDSLYGVYSWLSDRSSFTNVRWGNTKRKILSGVGNIRADAKALPLYVLFDDREENGKPQTYGR